MQWQKSENYIEWKFALDSKDNWRVKHLEIFI